MKRITQYEREQIALLTAQGLGLRDVARRICRDHSVVSRELKRNSAQLFPYEAGSAQRYAERRAKKTNVRKLKKQLELRDRVRFRLLEKRRPEQIAGRLTEHPPPGLEKHRVSHEAIYQWIYEDSPKGEPWLYHQLRRKHPERLKRFGRKRRAKPQIGHLVPVQERPESTDLGHLEVDSLLGRRHRGSLSVHYEKTVQWVRIHLLESRGAEATKAALESTLDDLPRGFAKTLTFDRGSETALHHELREPYRLMTFHCDPYSPWQKGGVENLNGLTRQFFPKGTDFRTVTALEVEIVEDLLNNRPRKGLRYLTPNEAMPSGALNT